MYNLKCWTFLFIKLSSSSVFFLFVGSSESYRQLVWKFFFFFGYLEKHIYFCCLLMCLKTIIRVFSVLHFLILQLEKLFSFVSSLFTVFENCFFVLKNKKNENTKSTFSSQFLFFFFFEKHGEHKKHKI